MKPFGIISDTHHHNWSSFSTTLPSGVNSRLQQILDETLRCADEVKKAGGDTIVHAGDLFHVRGSVAPSVLNPTLNVYRDLVNAGFTIIINAGNHDLEGKEATNIGSAITALMDVGCLICNSVTQMPSKQLMLVPYMNNVDELKKTLEKLQDERDAPNCDLIIHAGIDGVIKGLPDHGLSPEYLSKLKFNRVFAGHYHHHRRLDDRVWSIGALTHQTWSDVGSKAGFLIVSGKEVKWHASHAPNFIELDANTDADDVPLLVDGNYVRAKINSSKQRDIDDLRQFLADNGALGVTIVAQPPTGAIRTGSTVTAGASMEVSISDFIRAQKVPNEAALSKLCFEILKDVREAV